MPSPLPSHPVTCIFFPPIPLIFSFSPKHSNGDHYTRLYLKSLTTWPKGGHLKETTYYQKSLPAICFPALHLSVIFFIWIPPFQFQWDQFSTSSFMRRLHLCWLTRILQPQEMGPFNEIFFLNNSRDWHGIRVVDNSPFPHPPMSSCLMLHMNILLMRSLSLSLLLVLYWPDCFFYSHGPLLLTTLWLLVHSLPHRPFLLSLSHWTFHPHSSPSSQIPSRRVPFFLMSFNPSGRPLSFSLLCAMSCHPFVALVKFKPPSNGHAKLSRWRTRLCNTWMENPPFPKLPFTVFWPPLHIHSSVSSPITSPFLVSSYHLPFPPLTRLFSSP